MIIFIYGTLKRGFRNAGVMGGARFLGETRTAEALYRMVAVNDAEYPFPGVIEGSGRISGEVYSASESFLQELDAFELAGIDYRREKIMLEDKQEAYWYVLTPHAGLDILDAHPQIAFDETQNIYSWENNL